MCGNDNGYINLYSYPYNNGYEFPYYDGGYINGGYTNGGYTNGGYVNGAFYNGFNQRFQSSCHCFHEGFERGFREGFERRHHHHHCCGIF